MEFEESDESQNSSSESSDELLIELFNAEEDAEEAYNCTIKAMEKQL